MPKCHHSTNWCWRGGSPWALEYHGPVLDSVLVYILINLLVGEQTKNMLMEFVKGLQPKKGCSTGQVKEIKIKIHR